jgi:hypothetical protein
MTDEQTTVNDGGEPTQQTESQESPVRLGLDSIRNAEALHLERSTAAPTDDAEQVESTEIADADAESRMFGYKANKQETEIELEDGLSVEPGSPGEMQLKNILGGYGAFKAAQEAGGDAGLTDAIKEQTETLRQTMQPKEEATQFNPMDYVVPDEMPVVENAINVFERVGLDREEAEQLVNGIFGAIGRTRAYQSATSEETKQAETTNRYVQQMSRLHSIDSDVPNPMIDPEATAKHLQVDGGFVQWLRKDMNVQTDFLDPSIIKLYGLYKTNKQVATDETLSNANLGTKPAKEPVKRPPKDIDSLKTIASALEGGGGSPVGTQLTPQELAEFNNLPASQKKLAMNKDYRYWNAYARQNGGRIVNSNEELNSLKFG